MGWGVLLVELDDLLTMKRSARRSRGQGRALGDGSIIPDRTIALWSKCVEYSGAA